MPGLFLALGIPQKARPSLYPSGADILVGKTEKQMNTSRTFLLVKKNNVDSY